MDKILVQDLLVRCRIGVFPHEREHRQDVVVNLVLFCDLRPAAASDNFEDAIDYKQLKWQIVEFVESSSFRLIESLAAGIADIALADARVQKAVVRVDKPKALSYARSVGVEIERGRAL